MRQKNLFTSLVLSLVAICTLASCSNVYSPFVHLPSKPLKQNEGEVLATASALPYTKPDFYYATSGAGALARYGITDHFTLGAQLWGTAGSIQNGYINGLSID